jgi:S1-C subfamily serine protease
MDGIEENSVLYPMGFRNGDLIQSVNSSIVNTIADLSNHLLKGQGLAQQVFGLIRNQKKIQLAVNGMLPNIFE